MNAVQNIPVVTVVDGNVTTLSTDVATFFEKEHSKVIRSIENIIATLPQERLGNFSQTVVTRANPSGGAPIKSKAYRLTRDGFTFLAMGFTGARAQEFKWAYIDAFNKMEAALRQCPAQTQLPTPTLTEQQAYAIMSKVAMRAKRDGVKYQTIYHALKSRYQVTKYTHIPRDKFEDAVNFILTVDLRTPAVPEQGPKQKPIPETNHGVLVPPEFCEALRMRVYYERYVFGEYYERFYRFLQLVDSPLAGRFHEIRTSINLISLERQLAKVGFPVDDILNFKRTPRPNAIVAQ